MDANSASDPYETQRIAVWIARHGFQRVALQFPDHLLADAPQAVAKLRGMVPSSTKLFVLGDSTYGSSSVDEVAAEHYGADCIVHIGPSDQQHEGALPVLFVFGKDSLSATPLVEKLVAELRQLGENAPPSLALVCDVALQHASEKLAGALADAMRQCRCAEVAETGDAVVFVAVPQEEAQSCLSSPNTQRNDWRFGMLSTASWWAPCLGTLAIAAVAKREPLRLCGRAVQQWHPPPEPQATTATSSTAASPTDAVADPKTYLNTLPSGCGLVLCASMPGSPLERRLLLRHGSSRTLWRMDPETGNVERLSSQSLLLQRYRFVELARSAGIVGLVLAATGSRHAQALADRLEELLRRAGRRTYRFVVGRVTPEKLGNFPEVELFVSLASPEHFPWNSKEFMAPIASPYELEVALGAREWTGDYVTDPEELLRSPMPAPGTGPDTMLDVQTLGGGSRIRHFRLDEAARRRTSTSAMAPAAPSDMPAPALLTDGQHGVAQRYNTDAKFQEPQVAEEGGGPGCVSGR